MFHLDTAILHERQARFHGFLAYLVIANTQLQPQYFCSNVDCFLCNGRYIFGFTEHIYDFDLFSCLFCFCQRGIDAFAKQCLSHVIWIDENDVIAFSLQVIATKWLGRYWSVEMPTIAMCRYCCNNLKR